jgi:hypothetical protein
VSPERRERSEPDEGRAHGREKKVDKEAKERGPGVGDVDVVMSARFWMMADDSVEQLLEAGASTS